MSNLRKVPRKTAVFYGVLTILVLVVAGLAAISVYGTPSSSASSVTRTATVTRGTIQSSVSASGNISSASSENASFSTSGTLTSLRVQVGSKVKAGQVLATIDSAQAAANLASAKASLASARSALASAQAGGTASQRAQNAASVTSASTQLETARQTLTTDIAAVATAESQLAADRRLQCLATGSSNSTSNGTSSSSTQSSTSTSTQPATRTTGSAASSAPSATTGSANSSTPRSATLTGTVTPGGATTSYWFQYGTSAGYGSRTATRSAGAGTAAVSVTVTVSNLKEATTYLYRLVVKNAHGTRYGSPQVVTTATSACTTDERTIASAKQTVAGQRSTISQLEQSLASAQATVAAAVDPASVASAQAQVQQDEITVASDQKALAATTLRAPISGTVTAVNNSVGDTVGSSGNSSNAASAASSGSGGNGVGGTGGATSSSSSSSSSSGVVQIQNLKALDVVVGFPEADATKIAVGQPATVTLAALPNTEAEGKVVAVAPTATVVSNVVTYNVTIALTNPPDDVKVGMTADASVFVATRSNVLELPSAAITTLGSTSTVTLLEDGKRTTKTITTGLVGASTTEIVSGLTAGEVVVEPTVTVSASTGATGSTTGGFGGGGFGGGFGGGGLRTVSTATPLLAPARAAPADHPVIDLRSVSKTYAMGDIAVEALKRVSLTVERGDFVAIMGASGSGKSTLMNIIGCLDVPSRGHYWLDGVDVRELDDTQLALVRSRKIGFIFQSFNLVARTSALANVELPLVYAGVPGKERRARATASLERVGLGDRLAHMPNELSGGQQQRVAVARALVTNPALVLADEPTGNLDSASSLEVLEVFREVNDEGRTVALITHENDVAAYARRVVRLRDGQIVEDVRSGQ